MELEPRDGITVAELIDLLSEHPGDAVVELAIIAPVDEGDEDIMVDRYHIDGLVPWPDDETGDATVWLIGGNDSDVDQFIDSLEQGAG